MIHTYCSSHMSFKYTISPKARGSDIYTATSIYPIFQHVSKCWDYHLTTCVNEWRESSVKFAWIVNLSSVKCHLSNRVHMSGELKKKGLKASRSCEKQHSRSEPLSPLPAEMRRPAANTAFPHLHRIPGDGWSRQKLPHYITLKKGENHPANGYVFAVIAL